VHSRGWSWQRLKMATNMSAEQFQNLYWKALVMAVRLFFNDRVIRHATSPIPSGRRGFGSARHSLDTCTTVKTMCWETVRNAMILSSGLHSLAVMAAISCVTTASAVAGSARRGAECGGLA